MGRFKSHGVLNWPLLQGRYPLGRCSSSYSQFIKGGSPQACSLTIRFFDINNHKASCISYLHIIHSVYPFFHLHTRKMPIPQLESCFCYENGQFSDTTTEYCSPRCYGQGDVDAKSEIDTSDVNPSLRAIHSPALDWTTSPEIGWIFATGEPTPMLRSRCTTSPGDLYLRHQTEGIIRNRPVSAVKKWYCCGCM